MSEPGWPTSIALPALLRPLAGKSMSEFVPADMAPRPLEKSIVPPGKIFSSRFTVKVPPVMR
jgi:hypothetical protein